MQLATILLCFAYTAVGSVKSTKTGVSCKDLNGSPVDWFIAYKLPKIHHTSDPVMKDGLRFYYLDANKPVWHVSPIPINKIAQPIGKTIDQVYGNKDIMHLMYNDEKPNGSESESHGHTKGVVAFGASTGFWLVHSVPKFPGNESYEYPETGQHYGQAFMCMTLGTEGNLDKLVDQLLITYPYLYSDFVPQSLSTAKLRSLIAGKRNKTDRGSLVELKSAGGQSFYSFAKSDAYGKDLYSAWLAPWVRSSVYVETWMNGVKPLPSQCGQTYEVKNIRNISFGGETAFKETQDHSKWAVAETTPWSCVGGINRMESQEARCGGTVCFKNAQVNKSFKDIISEADACPKLVHYAPRVIIEQL